MTHWNHYEGSSDDKVKESKKTEIQELDEYLNDESNNLYQFVDNVKRRVKAAHNERKQLSAKFASEIERLEKENQAIQKRCIETEKLRDRYRQEINNYRTEIKKFGGEVRQNASSEVEKQLEELQKLNDQKDKEWERKLKESEETSNKMIRDQKHKIEQLENDIKQSNLKVKDLTTLMEESKFSVRDIGKLRQQLEDSGKKLNDTNDRLYRVSAKLKATEKELDETKTRLSKAMGDKLTDNNPNIADLSDKNRPTKLAEQFAEIYDNEWTDAFEKLEDMRMEENDIIKALLQILQDVMQFCKRKADRQMDDLKMVLSCSSSQVVRSIPDNITKQLKDCRRTMANVSKENIYQQFLESDGGKRRYIYKVKAFVDVCIDICWFMAIKDPPVVLGPVTERGDLFDTDLYKHYTSSGRYVEYVVWPALFLHEGGPVLAKGVAQGYGEKLFKRKEAWVNDAKYPEVTSRVEVGEIDKYGHGKSGSREITTRHNDYGTSARPFMDHRQPTLAKTSDAGSGQDRHHRTRIAEEMTRTYLKETRRIPAKAPPSKQSYIHERDPTVDEMNTFYRYYNRCDFKGGRNVLGVKVYERCWKFADKRFKLY